MITRPLVLSAVDSLDTIVQRFNDHCFSVWEGRRGREGVVEERFEIENVRCVCVCVVVLRGYGGQ